MSEIADQVTITVCAGLAEVFAKGVDRTGQHKFPKKFQDDAASLIKQVCMKLF
ncbi:hypothetical protein BJ875DRAFT_447429 [Amylocarpus encephaloides]|uniref:Uncharacterized protein n=1 Tax=Amylocarpus encephaloides TaxID=45428 RepID=A0A9P7YTY5_9HELO|nr:hypothetical protein BJ875DRAFT_447429 [Amylocarpus encephaloides]